MKQLSNNSNNFLNSYMNLLNNASLKNKNAAESGQANNTMRLGW